MCDEKNSQDESINHNKYSPVNNKHASNTINGKADSSNDDTVNQYS